MTWNETDQTPADFIEEGSLVLVGCGVLRNGKIEWIVNPTETDNG